MRPYKPLYSEASPKEKPFAKIKDLEKFVLGLRELTKRNEHGKALVEIAKKLDYPIHAKKLELIDKMVDMEEHLPQFLGKYRDTVSKDLFKYVLRDYGPEVTKQLRGAI